jgi:hypothetical protein
VRYTLGTGFVVGQWCIPPATEINLDKSEAEMTAWERMAAGHTPPIDAIARDWECAWEMHLAYGEDFQHRLKRILTPFHQDMFDRLVDGSLRVLSRAQVALARQLNAPMSATIEKERAEQARRKRVAADFKQQLTERLNAQAK